MNEYREVTHTGHKADGVSLQVHGTMAVLTIDLLKWSIEGGLTPRRMNDLDTDQPYTQAELAANTKVFADDVDDIISIHTTE